jgi:hypothetical protein
MLFRFLILPITTQRSEGGNTDRAFLPKANLGTGNPDSMTCGKSPEAGRNERVHRLATSSRSARGTSVHRTVCDETMLGDLELSSGRRTKTTPVQRTITRLSQQFYLRFLLVSHLE